MSYDILARFYDKFNSSIDYACWADEISGFLLKRGIESSSSILDIACGTGKMTLELAACGFTMTGVDLSPEMLALAQNSAAENNLFPLFVCQDMTCLELSQTFDSAVCCLDSVNYIGSLSALDGFFARVSEHIRPGGYFFFDVNTEYKFENIYASNSYVYDESSDGVFCVWQNFYSPRRRLCDFDLTFFVKGEDEKYERLFENQREYLYTDDELCTLLEKHGLKVELISAEYDFSLGEGRRISDSDERHYYICKKI